MNKYSGESLCTGKLDALTATVLDVIVDTPGLNSEDLALELYFNALLPKEVRVAAYKLHEMGYVNFDNKRAYPTVVGTEALKEYSDALGAFY